MISPAKHAATAPLHRLFQLRLSRVLFIRLALLLTLFVGLDLRLYGVAFGLPHIYGFGELSVVQSGYQLQRAGFGTDEPQIVHSALRILANKTLNPGYFDYPGTPLIYMGAALYLGIFIFGLLTGFFHNTSDFEAAFINDPTLFYITGRLLVVFISMATIVLIYLIGKRMFNRTAGLIAAVLLAISPLHIFLSKIFRVDVLLVLFLLAAFWFCLDIVQKKTWRSYILAGIFTGLAAMTKYPGILFAATIVLAHLMSGARTWKDHAKLFAAGFATAVGAFAGSPYVFLDVQSVLISLRDEGSPHLGGAGEGLIRNILWYFREAFPVSISITGLIMAGIGFAMGVFSRNREKILLLSFPVVFLVFISLLTPRWERWILPVVPFFILAIAYALDELQNWIVKRVNMPVGTAAVLLLGAAICIPLVQLDLLHGRTMMGEDTRTTARTWMLDNIPMDSHVLMELDTPQTPLDQFQYYSVTEDNHVSPLDLTTMRHNDVIIQGRLGWMRDTGEVTGNHIDYMVISDYYDRYVQEQTTYPEEYAMYNDLMALGELVYEVKPQPGETQGPHIRIYKLDG
jgi:hypothetical protein